MTYKLIKEYPYSPALGTISERDQSAYPEFWEPIRKVLFVTKDGIEIRDGDQYYNVFTNTGHALLTPYKLFGPTAAQDLKDISYQTKDCVFFSSKLVAEKFIFEHRPSISINDIKLFAENTHVNLAARLISLVESRSKA